MSLLPSATKLRRLCFYRRVSVHSGGVPDQVHPPDRYTPPGTRYTPQAGTPPRAGTPRTRYTPLDPGTPPGPGTPPDQVHPPDPGIPPPDQVHPSRAGTPQTRYTPPGPGTPPPRYGHCCGRYAFLCICNDLSRVMRTNETNMAVRSEASALYSLQGNRPLGINVIASATTGRKQSRTSLIQGTCNSLSSFVR